MSKPILLLVWLSLLSPLLGATALAEPLPPPAGAVILRVTGAIERTNVGDEAHFDRAMLEALPARVVETHTPWTDGKGRFEGPLVRDVLAAVGADGDCLSVTALNDFTAEVPVSDVRDYAVILALTHDGDPMAIRDFGPIFVIYPFDDHPDLLTDVIRFRSVWQVADIRVH